MRLTIVPSDNIVIIDGRAISISLSNYPIAKTIRAVQWDGNKGHIEFYNPDPENYRFNEPLLDLTAFQAIIDAWKRTAAAEDAAPPPEPIGARYAQRNPEAGQDYGGSGPRSQVRQKSGYTTVRGEGIQSSGQENRNSSKEEEEMKRRL